jgi:hypothetical protein
VQLEDAELDINAIGVSYAHSFALLGQSAKVAALVPFAWVSGSALFTGAPVSRDFSGLGDPAIRLTTNLLGAPALTVEEFPRYEQDWIVGAGLTVTVPLGRYDPDRLVNIGTNTWSFRPELGVSKRWRRLTLEAVGSVRLYTDNDEFLETQTRELDPLYAMQAHVIYTFGRGIWAALNTTWYGGGQTTVDGVPKDDRQGNVRVGGTITIPLTRRNSLRLHGSSGVTARTGTDFDTVAVSWTYRWGKGF